MEKLYVKNLETGKVVYTDEILVEYNKTTFVLKGFTKYSLEVLDEINDIIKRFKAPYRVFATFVETIDEVIEVAPGCRVLEEAEKRQVLENKNPDGRYFGMTKGRHGFTHVATLSEGKWTFVEN